MPLSRLRTMLLHFQAEGRVHVHRHCLYLRATRLAQLLKKRPDRLLAVSRGIQFSPGGDAGMPPQPRPVRGVRTAFGTANSTQPGLEAHRLSRTGVSTLHNLGPNRRAIRNSEHPSRRPHAVRLQLLLLRVTSSPRHDALNLGRDTGGPSMLRAKVVALQLRSPGTSCFVLLQIVFR